MDEQIERSVKADGIFGGEPRPEDRMGKFLAMVETAWGRAPDQRFGQLVYNALLRDAEADADDLFNYEDDVTLRRFQDYAKSLP